MKISKEVSKEVKRLLLLAEKKDKRWMKREKIRLKNPLSPQHDKAFHEWWIAKEEYYRNIGAMVECIKNLWEKIKK